MPARRFRAASVRASAVLLTTAAVAGGLLGAPAGAVPTSQAVRPAGVVGPGGYEPVPATRVMDTRSGVGGVPAAKVPAHSTVTFDVARHRPVPTDAVSTAVLNLTVLGPGLSPGSLSVYPGGTAFPGTVSMVFGIGGSYYEPLSVQQQLTVPLGADGSVTVRNNAAFPVTLVADVVGFYVAGPAVAAGMFAPVNARLLDTRGGIGAPRAAVGPGRGITVPITGRAGIPAGASAVVANVTVLSPYLTGLLPITDNDGIPATVNLRFVAHAPVQTMRAIRLGSDGKLTFFNQSSGTVQLVLDVVGYFLGGQVSLPGGYVPAGAVPLVGGKYLQMPHRGNFPLPTGTGSGVGAVNLLTVPAVPGGPIELAIYGSGVAWNASISVLSTTRAQPSEVSVKLGGSPQVTMYNPGGSFYLREFLTGSYLG